MKKSFLIYDDWGDLVETLPDEDKGRVFSALFRFSATGEVGDLSNPAADMLLKVMIKQLRDDKEKYDRKCEKNKENSAKRFNDGYRTISNDNDGYRTMTDKDKDKDKELDKDKEKESLKDKEKTNVNVSKKESEKVGVAAEAATSARKEKFYASLVPFVDKYGKDMIRDFFDYWSEMNRSKTKMRFEQQATWELALRLKTWADREKIPKKDGNPKVGVVLTDNSLTKYKKEDLWK